MALSYGPNLGLLINAATGEAHADAFRAFKRGIDCLVMPSVLDRTDTPPGSPANGDRYLLGASPTGAWAGNAHKIARYNGSAWEFYRPTNGWSVVVVDEATVYRYLSGAWTAATTSGSSSISGTLSVNNGSVAYTATRTGQIATIKSGALSTTELLFGMRSTGIPAIQSARSTDDAAQELQLQPFGGSTRIGSGIVSSGVGSGDLIIVGGASVGGAFFADSLTSVSSIVASGGSMTSGASALAATAAITIRSAAGYGKQIIFRTGASLRWVVQQTNASETGSDAGSDFKYTAYNDSGASIDDPLSITRASGGLITVGGSTSRPVYFTGNLGLGTSTPTNILSFGGNSARTIWMERHTTANTAGNNLTIEAGGATSGATDKNGGNAIISSGMATGNGMSGITFRTVAPGQGSGTTDRLPTDKFRLTGDGGYAISLINKTGAATVKGTVVYADPSVDMSFEINPIDGDMPIGVVLDDGIADGSAAWVVIAGIAKVLLVDSVATTRSYVAYSSGTTAGRIDTAATVPAAITHFREVGHTLESVGAGTNKLVRCALHFN